MKIMGPPPKTSNGNQFVLVMTDHYLKLARAVLTSERTGTHIASMFMNNKTITYKIPAYVMTDSKSKFISKFFE